jgi:putative endonuclease
MCSGQTYSDRAGASTGGRILQRGIISQRFALFDLLDARLHGHDEKDVTERSFPRKRESRELDMAKQPCVYILASQQNGTLYIGVTSNLVKRAWEHKNNVTEGFTKKYGVHRLVYYELHGDMIAAIAREKQLKKWNRAWKLRLIEERNPLWRDLWDEIL